jgi:hypothetical protein
MPNSTNYQPVPEDVDDPEILMEHVCRAVEGGGYWPDRIRSVLAAAGLTVTRIQHEEEHPTVWLMWLTRTSFALDADKMTAAKQIRKLLVKGGLKIGPKDLSVIDRRGDKLRCAFVLEMSSPAS